MAGEGTGYFALFKMWGCHCIERFEQVALRSCADKAWTQSSGAVGHSGQKAPESAKGHGKCLVQLLTQKNESRES